MLAEEVLGVEKESFALGRIVQRTGNVEVHVRVFGRDQPRQVASEGR